MEFNEFIQKDIFSYLNYFQKINHFIMTDQYDGVNCVRDPNIPAPIYEMYRGTPIGEALTSVLNDFKDVRMINDKQIELLLSEFDKQMTASLCNLPEENFSISQGNPVDHRFVSDYHHIVVTPATIQFSDGAVTTPSIEIISIRGDPKEPEDQPKGRKRK